VKRILLLGLLLVPHLVHAQTDVSGSQSGVWTLAGSPYRVTGQLTVPSGQTLTIEPGVEVNFQGHYKFTVNGKLMAIGAEGAMIRFTTDNQAIGWGGIRISSGDISELSHCRIEYGKTPAGEYPDIHGGGLALLGSDAVVTSCTFADNDATGGDLGMGGAVYAYGTGGAAEPLTRFVDCTFTGNHCYGEGGAIKFTGDWNSEVVGCTFIGNDCDYGGGAISLYNVDGTRIERCVFADNYTMFANGGAIHTLGFSNTLSVVNCTVVGNTAVTGDGGGIYLANAQANIINTIVRDNPGMFSDDVYLTWGSGAEIHYSNLAMPDGASGGNNINQDPLFVNAPAYDFNLEELSPCVDEGTAFFALAADTIVDMDPSEYFGTAPDMGAFEYTPATGLPEGAQSALRLYRNYPNPFAVTTSIHYRLASESPVSLKVYSVLGREVRTLLEARQPAGGHSVTWDGLNGAGRRVSPGAYYLRLRAGDEVRSMQMLISR